MATTESDVQEEGNKVSLYIWGGIRANISHDQWCVFAEAGASCWRQKLFSGPLITEPGYLPQEAAVFLRASETARGICHGWVYISGGKKHSASARRS